MAIGIALAAEEHGKIVSARHLCNAVKSYLPTHGTFHKIAPCALCSFADAIRKECAEAKPHPTIRWLFFFGRNPQGVRRGKVVHGIPGIRAVQTQSARSAPRQSFVSTHKKRTALDAIRKKCAEAKVACLKYSKSGEDAIRKECAEAKRGNERFVFPVFRTLRNFSGETRMLRQMLSARINPPEAALVFPKSASGGFLLLFCHTIS